MADFSKIELIVFDIDGTLAETDDFYVEKSAAAICKVLPFIKKNRAEKVIRPLVNTGETVLHSFYRLLDLAGLDSKLSIMHSKMSVGREYKYREINGMREALFELGRSHKLGILTSGGRNSTDAFLDKYGLKDTIAYVISAEDCKYIKPHPMPLKMIAEEADVPIGNCLMVGDTVFDIICAKRAGACSAAVKSGFDSACFLRFHHADILLDSVSDLPKLFLSDNSEIEKSIDKPKDLV